MRVARALGDLPLVCASFEAGRLSFSKVRAITRVATPANEALLVSYAESSTAAQLETVLRGYRRMSRLDDATYDQVRFERRSLAWFTDAEGFVCLRAKLAPDDGAVVIAQLERLAKSRGEDDPQPAADDAGGVSAETAETAGGDLPLESPRWLASDPISARRTAPQSPHSRLPTTATLKPRHSATASSACASPSSASFPTGTANVPTTPSPSAPFSTFPRKRRPPCASAPRPGQARA